MEPRDMKDLKLAAADLTVGDALVLIGDYIVNNAGNEDKPGITAALGCMLSIDEIDAGDLWLELIAHRDREIELQSIATWLQHEPVYRLEYDKVPRGPYFGTVVYMEALDIKDAVSAPSDGHSTIISARKATIDDAEEVFEIAKRESR